MTTDIVSFGQPIEPELSSPAPERLIEGRPEQRIWNHFTDASEQFFAGRWSSTPGKWRVRYTENEFCHLTEGRVRITSREGGVWTFAAGDAFVVPAGFEGTWEVLESCSKLYAIFQPLHR